MRVYSQLFDGKGLDTKGFRAEDCPVLALYGLCNAFPSITHLWLLAVLRCVNLAGSFYNLINLLIVIHVFVRWEWGLATSCLKLCLW